MEEVNRSTGETVHLAALQGDAVVTVAFREALQAVRVDTGKLGRLDAPHATATGKAILAWLPENEVRRIVGERLKRCTENTITDYPELIEALRTVRRTGYAVCREEFLPGVFCVGAAVRDQAGAVIGAISASMPTMRADDKHIALLCKEITAAARGLSADFGDTGAQASQVAAG